MTQVTIVAEIGPNHNGSLDNALQLIREAKEAGADFVKFQAYTADELIALRGDGRAPEPWGSEGWTMRTLYEAAATPADWYPALIAECEAVDIGWFASVFGADSLTLMESLGCPMYKIAAMECGNGDLVSAIEATKKPIAISSPQDPAGLWPVYCPPGYPQESFHLGNIKRGGYWGFSYHHNDPQIPAYAVAAGARYVEVHLHLETEPSRFEAAFALTPLAFGEMVRRIRHVEGLL